MWLPSGDQVALMLRPSCVISVSLPLARSRTATSVTAFGSAYGRLDDRRRPNCEGKIRDYGWFFNGLLTLIRLSGVRPEQRRQDRLGRTRPCVSRWRGRLPQSG